MGRGALACPLIIIIIILIMIIILMLMIITLIIIIRGRGALAWLSRPLRSFSVHRFAVTPFCCFGTALVISFHFLPSILPFPPKHISKTMFSVGTGLMGT